MKYPDDGEATKRFYLYFGVVAFVLISLAVFVLWTLFQ